MTPYVTGTIHPTLESLLEELAKIDEGYGYDTTQGRGWNSQRYYVDWTRNEVRYQDGDPLAISFRHTNDYDY